MMLFPTAMKASEQLDGKMKKQPEKSQVPKKSAVGKVSRRSETRKKNSNPKPSLMSMSPKMLSTSLNVEEDEDVTEEYDVIGPRVIGKGIAIVNNYYSEKKLEDETSSKKHGKEEEDGYFNVETAAVSPKCVSPIGSVKKLADTERLMSLPIQKVRIRNFFSDCYMVVATLNIAALLHFPTVMMLNGGVYFLIPFVLCTFFITMPIGFIELVLGQFSSMPHIYLFSNIVPIFTGFGYILMTVQVIASATTKFEHKYMSMLIESMMRMIADARARFCDITNYGIPACFDPNICAGKSFFFMGKCFNPDYVSANSSYLKTTKVMMLSRYFLQNTPELAQVVQPTINARRIFSPKNPQAHYFSAIFFSLCLVFLVARPGLRPVAESTAYILGASVLSLISLFVVLVYSWRDEAFGVFELLGYSMEDFAKIASPATWYVAFLMSMMCFSVGEGTRITVGATRKFHSNVYRATFVSFVYPLFFFCLTPFIIGAVLFGGARVAYSEVESRTLSVIEARAFVRQFDLAFDNIYYFFEGCRELEDFLFFGFAVSFLSWQVAQQMISAEAFIMLAHRAFKSLAHLNELIVRGFVLLVYVTAVATLHVKMKHTEFEVLLTAMIFIVFFEITVLWFYSIKRFLPNLSSLLEPKEQEWTYKFRLLFFVVYKVLLPLILTLFIGLQIWLFHHPKYYLVPIVLLPLFIYRAVKEGVSRESWKSLFRPTPTWGPLLIKDRKTAQIQERAIRLSI
ncbi:unnamed protein product [Caenorhabditis auriculariae]|uniref:Uncharacterized protein n=1 Tax=Caenorhabditis auriculariae TaxID=2777116 RepID=A0A8S1GZ67_9PELO|nr:unnamed protein product [Caenorhabditis auriculariae]